MSEKPNFLYIMCDQLRADWLGCYGHKVVKTPNIDALAATGTRFDKFYVASPICMPNRASFMTGRFPSVNGLRWNGCSLPQRANTFVDVLRKAGYNTASIGKSHLQPFTEVEAEKRGLDGDNMPIQEAWEPDNGRYDLEQPSQYRGSDRFEFPLPYYGFNHVDMVTGHGDRAGGHYLQWFRDQHENWEQLRSPQSQLPHSYTCPQGYRTAIPEDSYPTAYIRNSAKKFLSEQSGAERPFFAYVSFADPHHPFNPPGKYWDMYDPDDFDLTLRFDDHKNPPPPLVHAHATFIDGGGQKTPQTAFMANERQQKEIMALTAGMLTMIDDAVGELVQTLKDTGQYDNTVIVFNSDHGDYMGDFDMMLKGAWPLESINRVPMIWSDPLDRVERTTTALTSTIDISASVIDRAGLQPYFGIQGESFLECVQGNQHHRDDIFIEYNDPLSRMGFSEPARVRTVLTDKWRLTTYKDQEWGELYDRQSDPQETLNLWDDPSHAPAKAEMFERLAANLIAQMDESPRSALLA